MRRKQSIKVMAMAILLSGGLAFSGQTVQAAGGGGTIEETNAQTVSIDEVNFPDPVFREKVKAHFDADQDGFLSDLEIHNVYEFDCTGQKESEMIQSVKGIEYLTELQSLRLDTNNIKELDLSGNTKLKKLFVDTNVLETIDISKCTELQVLNVGYNRLKSLDVSNNTELYDLNCWGNQLRELDVTKNPLLTFLDCTTNELAILDVSKNPLLVELDCRFNELETLDLTNNKDLVEIYAVGNKLTSVDIGANNAMKEVKLQDNKIKSIDVSACPNITSLLLENNQVESLDLSKNPKLSILMIDRNPIKKINIKYCPNLVRIYNPDDGVLFMIQEEEGSYTYLSYGNGNDNWMDVDEDDMIITGLFQDLEENAWYKDAVMYVQDNAFMNGTSEVTFSPNMTLTRAQFVTVLHNIEGGKSLATPEYSDKFMDVPKDVWYTNPVMWALKNGVTSGVADDKFGTDLKITREQLATLLYKYAGIKGDMYSLTKDADALKDYPDAGEVSDWATEAMQWAVSNGVMSGKPGQDGKNILNPEGNASRAECAQMIMNFITKTTKFE